MAHTRLTILSRYLMPCLETICMLPINNVHIHPFFDLIRFKGLMLFINLHFSFTVQRSCITMTNCSSCWCVILVSVFLQ